MRYTIRLQAVDMPNTVFLNAFHHTIIRVYPAFDNIMSVKYNQNDKHRSIK